MSTSQLLMAFTVGTALLALWSFVRLPDIAPTTMKAAFLRMVVALVLLQLGASLLGAGVEIVPAFGPLLVVVAVVPVLTYAFLASIWFLKVCADQMRGAF
jgi:hypothetical protein